MNFQNISIAREGAIAVLTIDRPKALNALNHETLHEIEAAMRELESDDAVLGIVVTGGGAKAFVAGADIREMQAMSAADAEKHARFGQSVVSLFADSRKVTIAAVNGYALGGGLEVALACDLRLASENAIMGLPEVGLGVIPGFGGTQRLARLVGAGRAKELVLTGRKLSADEAERIGLVNRVVPVEKIVDEAKALLADILKNGPVAVRLAKETIDAGLQVDLRTGLTIEEKAFGLCFATADQKEGMSAFSEKRAPVFTGK